jgi:hypothetical protein
MNIALWWASQSEPVELEAIILKVDDSGFFEEVEIVVSLLYTLSVSCTPTHR